MREIICPHCHNPVYDEDALLCHFCGESLERVAQGGVLGKMRAGFWGWFFTGIVFLVALASVVAFLM
ncbi:MAG: hypothetical protein V2A70_01880 [Candidatus Omnitrophota bacterium]